MSMEINRKILKCRLCHKMEKKGIHQNIESSKAITFFLLFDNNCVHVHKIRAHDRVDNNNNFNNKATQKSLEDAKNLVPMEYMLYTVKNRKAAEIDRKKIPLEINDLCDTNDP